MTGKEFVEKFQCPGCISGSDTTCGKYTPDVDSGGVCRSHFLGTTVNGRQMALGLPGGFCFPGWDSWHGGLQPFKQRNVMNLRFFEKGMKPDWNNLNVPVWAMTEDGFLFVRTYQPRIDSGSVDIIEGGTLDMCPVALDVSTFKDEID